MLMLEGKKRFWFLPSEETEICLVDSYEPQFVSSAAIEPFLSHGLLAADIEERDLLYFPG
jgi:hypothetical protein